VSLPHDYTQDLAGIQAPVLLIHGRYDRVVPFEVSIAILNHIADSPRAAEQLRALATVRETGRVGRAGIRVPAGLLRGAAKVKTHQSAHRN
jgi:pimeloyl-ACP methyl ester carboxylesterase